MEINNENELIEIIKDKSFEEIKSYFQEYQITPAKFNYFNHVLIYFIKNKGSFEIIEYFIKRQQKENYPFLLNNAEALFYSIEYFRFEIAKLLLNYGVKIESKNVISENIIEYLVRVDKLYEKQLSFILKIKKDLSLLTNKVLFKLFGSKYCLYRTCKNIILNYKFTINKENIINTLIIAKKRIPMTDKELQEYFSNNLKPPVINFNIKNENGSTLFLHNILRCGLDFIHAIITYSNKNNIILNLNEQNNEGVYPLLYRIHDRSIIFYFELLIDHARKNKIVLEMNRQDKNGNNTILNLIKSEYEDKYVPISGFDITYVTIKYNVVFKVFTLLFDYAKETNYILDLNAKDNDGNFPLSCISHHTNYFREDITKKLVHLIIDYASEFNIILELCEKNDEGELVILEIFNDCKMLKLLIEYAEKLNIVSDILKYANILLYNGISNNDGNITRLILGTAQNNNIKMDFGKYESSILHDSINCKRNDIFRLIMKYVKHYNIKLKLNEENKYGNYALLMAIQRKSIEKVQLLMEYAHANNIVLELNKQISNGLNPLLAAIDDNNNCVRIVQLLMNHAKENNIILKINARDEDGNNPLLKAIIKDKVEVLRLLEDYAKENNIILEVKNKNDYDNCALLEGSRNTKILGWLIHYTEENNITLDINEKNKKGDFPLLKLCGNDECFTMLVNFAKENNITLKINDKNSEGEYPLLEGVRNHKLVKLLMNYANENNILLEINDKDKSGNSPLTNIFKYKDFVSLQLLMEYAQENNIVLDINSKDEEGRTPSFIMMEKFNGNRGKKETAKIQIVQLLIDYAYKNNIILNIDEKIHTHTEYREYTDFTFKYVVENSNFEMFKLFIEYAQHRGILLSLFKDNYNDDLNNKCSLLSFALKCCYNSQIFKFIVEVAGKNNIKYNLYEDSCDSLLSGIKYDDVEIIQMIIQNAKDNNVIITDHELNLFLLYVCDRDYNESEKMVKLVIDYAKENNVILTERELNHSLLNVCKINNNSNVSGKVVKLILDYAKDINTILTVDHASLKLSPFAHAVHRNNYNVVRLLMAYSKENKINLYINQINHYTKKPLFLTKDIAMTKLIMEYAKENKMVIDINLKNHQKRCSLSYLIKNDDTEMVRLLIQYANENNIILDLNSADKDGNYPFLRATRKCKETMVKLLINYANENDIIIDINRKNNQGNFPLLLAIRGNKVEVVQLLIDYAKTHHITLNVDQLKFYDGHLVVDPYNKNKLKYNTKEITELILEYKKGII